MKYMLLIHQGDAPTPRNEGWDRLSDEEKAAIGTDYREVSETPGVSPGLQLEEPETATTVRVTNGKSQVLNGPYADSKEQFGGYYVIDVPDLDAALSWAARCPAASHGVVEVRPTWA